MGSSEILIMSLRAVIALSGGEAEVETMGETLSSFYDGDCFIASASSTGLYLHSTLRSARGSSQCRDVATSCCFVRVIARAGLLQDFVFGGKDVTDDGTPEGLPLNVRFFHLDGFGALTVLNQRDD